MKLNDSQVLHVAKLARLALAPDEVATLQQQLSAILDAVDELAQVDTTEAAAAPPPEGMAHLRDDVVQGEVGAKAALQNAPQARGTSFAIPKVLE
jgi:aspartyl-tRNA(Asn)/glutamyl-tRNA(Gln) amidotransferase subunit C